MTSWLFAVLCWILLCCFRPCVTFTSAPRIWASPSRNVHFGPPQNPFSSSKIKRRRKKQSFGLKTMQNDAYDDDCEDTYCWLQRSTESLLATEPGSLVKGKWHELVSMMSAWSKRAVEDDDQTTTTTAPLVLERLLKRAIDEQRAAGGNNAECTAELYNYVIDAWTACPGRAASRRARQILHLLQRTYDEEQDPKRRPNAHSFLTVLKSVAKTEKAPVAREMLRWMEQLYSSGQNPDAKPTMAAYVTVLDAFATNSGHMENAGERAEEVLQQMHAAGDVPPSTLCYNIAIKAWVASRRGRQSAEHAERILEEMEAPADVVTYSSVVHAWATSGMKEHAAERAEDILNRIEEDPSVEPNVVVYNACLNAWCKSESPSAVNRTEALLRRMEEADHVAPDLVSYNTYIHALTMMNRKEPGLAKRADDTRVQLEERFDAGEIDFAPNVFAYNLVIEGWVRSQHPNAASRACDVLRKLVKRDGVEPDAISFNQVINALARSSLPGSAQKAEDLLHYMDESYKNGIYDFKADVVGYTSAISAWSRSGQAERAERLLNEMEQRYLAGEVDLKPNDVAFNAVIDAWARSGKGTLGARRAEALLQRMQDMYEMGDPNMQPNIITYNSLLNAWARSGTRCCAYQAERYLNLMWELYKAGNKSVKPDGKSYNTVINAISKSKNEGKAQKALRTLRRMEKLYRAGDKDTRPSERSYTAVLNSCAFPAVLDPKSRKKALDTAIFTLAELQGSPYGDPNHLTYGMFMKAVANLMPRDDELRRMLVEEVFIQCCKDGQVGEMVLAHLRYAAPKDLYRELLKDVTSSGGKVQVHDLPLEWRCNVQDHRRWPTRTRTAMKKRGKHAVRHKSRYMAP